MSDTTATVTETDESAEGATATETEATTETPAEKTASTEDELPDWAKEKLSKANKEAAKYRVVAREAADKAKTEAEAAVAGQLQELSDKHTALAVDLDTANTELLKVRSALNADVLRAAVAAEDPAQYLADFASLLQGSTAEEIKASAEKAARLLGTPRSKAVDPSISAVGGPSQEATPGLGRLMNAYSSNTKG
jgi:hypothetical protein